MKTHVLAYATALAGGALLLQWFEHQYALRFLSTELYVVLLAVGFTALGIWVGHRLTGRPPAPRLPVNRDALAGLGISRKEHAVLELLAKGYSNREIAERLFVSTNTIKSHVASLYRKLEVSRRTQAVNRARELQLIA
ncbi:MAG: LuxR C-terminal-related transcriptional regulator [Pseudomonadota bacterium]